MGLSMLFSFMLRAHSSYSPPITFPMSQNHYSTSRPLFQFPSMRENMQFLLFWIWLISSNTNALKSHPFCCILTADNSPQCTCAPRSSTVTCWWTGDSLHLLALGSRAATNVNAQMPPADFISLECLPRVVWLDHMVVLALVFEKLHNDCTSCYS